MTLAYTHDAAGTGDKFYNCDERRQNTKEDLNFRGLFSLQGKSSSKEKIKVFGKSAVAIHSLILRATEADLSVYVGRALAAICRSRCYNRLLWCKRALDRVKEIENEIKQDLTHDGPFRAKRLAKESGQKPEAEKRCKCQQQYTPKYHIRSEGWNWCLSIC